MAIDTKILMQLREATGAGLNDCQSALLEAQGDPEKAIELLRKKGAIKAAKKLAERTAHEGLIDCYIHPTGKVAVMLDIRCETDFVARNPEFKSLAHDISLHIAAINPSYLRPEDIPAAELDKEKEIYQEQLKREGKPQAMWDKITEGKLKKFYQDNCLLQQPFVKDDSVTIGDLLTRAIAKLGEKIEITRFVRYQI